MNLGDRIRQRRLQLNMSQQELADKLGYTSRSTINKIENNANNLRQTKIVEFAKALQTTPIELMGWSDVDEITEKVQQLSDTDRQIILSMIDRMLGK